MKAPESQPTRWKLLRKQYRERGIALVLGAGVSTGCGLPGWADLIRRVAQECWGPNGATTVKDLRSNGMSLPTIAGLLDAERPRNSSFAELLPRALYRDFPFKDVLTTPEDRSKLVNLVHGTSSKLGNSTMRAVAALCAVKDVNGFVANPKVHAVITSNVDAVLRTYVRARYGAWLLRTIESAKHNPRSGRIPTYYMHGFLRFSPSSAKEDDEQVPTVFTEAEYFDFFNRPHSVFNYTFLYLLREYNCVFIGMSMEDQNIRRLLHYSVSDRRGMSASDPRRTGLRHFALLPRSRSKHIDKRRDLALHLLGTRALWLEGYTLARGL
jgi:hypothetical protein